MSKDKNNSKSLSKRWTITIAICTILFSGAVAAIISDHLYKVNFKNQTKVNSFNKLFSNRYDITSKDFIQAMNEVFIVYNDSEEVMKSLNKFHNSVTSNNGNNLNDEMLELFKVMADEIDIDHKSVSDSFIMRPFDIK